MLKEMYGVSFEEVELENFDPMVSALYSGTILADEIRLTFDFKYTVETLENDNDTAPSTDYTIEVLCADMVEDDGYNDPCYIDIKDEWEKDLDAYIVEKIKTLIH